MRHDLISEKARQIAALNSKRFELHLLNIAINKVSTLNIDDIDLTHQTLKVLAEALHNNTSIKSLYIDEINRSHRSDQLEFAEFLRDIITNNITITSITIRSDRITDQSLKFISTAFSCNRTLNELSLTCDKITDLDVIHLLNSLNDNNTLVKITINSTQLGKRTQLNNSNLKSIDINISNSLNYTKSDTLKSAIMEKNIEKNPSIKKLQIIEAFHNCLKNSILGPCNVESFDLKMNAIFINICINSIIKTKNPTIRIDETVTDMDWKLWDLPDDVWRQIFSYLTPKDIDLSRLGRLLYALNSPNIHPQITSETILTSEQAYIVIDDQRQNLENTYIIAFNEKIVEDICKSIIRNEFLNNQSSCYSI